MASRSLKFLIAEEIENKDGHKDAAEGESSPIHSMNADLMLMLMGEDQDIGKIPFFYSYEGNA